MNTTGIINAILTSVVDELQKDGNIVTVHIDELINALASGCAATLSRIIDKDDVAQEAIELTGQRLVALSQNKEVFQAFRKKSKFQQ